MKSTYKAGSWNVVCQRCGINHKAEELRKEWNGLMVCSYCYETRHPQDLLKVQPEAFRVPFSRRPPTPVYQYVADLLYTELEQPIQDETSQFIVG
jgi:hypothetical protein